MHPVDFALLKWTIRYTATVEDSTGTKHEFEKQWDKVIWKGVYDQGLPPSHDMYHDVTDELIVMKWSGDCTFTMYINNVKHAYHIYTTDLYFFTVMTIQHGIGEDWRTNMILVCRKWYAT